jgi:4-carboxymuconolactone decarboxylase
MHVIKDHHYEAGLDLRRSMFGSALAEQQVENTTELTDKMQEIVTRWCFGDLWQRGGLDAKTRSLITLAMLIASGKSHEIRVHLRGGLANGLTEEEIRELMLHSVLYCGIPAAMEGFRAAEEVLGQLQDQAAGQEAEHV